MRALPQGIGFVLVAQLLLALQDAISRILIEDYPAPFFVTLRYWVFAVFVLALTARSEGGVAAAARSRMPAVQIFRGVLLAGQILIFVTALGAIGLSATHAIFAAYPLVATLLAVPVLGERIGIHRIAAVAVGFCGLLLILRPGTEVFRPDALLALAAMLMMALYSVLTRLATRADGSSGPAFFWTGIAGAAMLSAVGPFFWAAPDALGWVLIGALSLVSLAGHWCLIRAYALAEAVRLQPFVYGQPILALLIGPIFFAEPADLWLFLGASITVGAGLYAFRRESQAG